MPIQCTCLQCGSPFTVKPYRVAGGQGRFCSPACFGEHRTASLPTVPCAQCGKPFHRNPSKIGKFCSRACGFASRTPPDRFWSKVNKDGPVIREELGPCWVWTGSLTAGYGQFHIIGTNRPLRAHRLAYEWAYGPIPDGRWVCHKCDNPPCCNPTHLFLGEAADNVRDMIAKGRRVPGKPPDNRGEAHGMAKLTSAQVREIRRRYQAREPHRVIAQHYGISTDTVSQIGRGLTWKHLF